VGRPYQLYHVITGRPFYLIYDAAGNGGLDPHASSAGLGTVVILGLCLRFVMIPDSKLPDLFLLQKGQCETSGALFLH